MMIYEHKVRELENMCLIKYELERRGHTVVIKHIEDEEVLSSWYIMAHFLAPRQINHLMGSMKKYIQFTEDIDRRARNTGNEVYNEEKNMIAYYKKIIQVLEFVMLYSGQISNEITDYFKNNDEYAIYLNNFLDFQIFHFPLF